MRKRFLALIPAAVLVAVFFLSGAGKTEIDITKYGAIPDDGVDDTTYIQAAFADAVGGGVPCKIVFPRGTYVLSDKITIANASNIDVIAYGAKITASVRICPWWFCLDNCTNVHFYGGDYAGPETTSTFYDRHISLEGINRTITGIATDETITVQTTIVSPADTSYDHGLEVGDTVTITGSNSTPSIDGTWTVSALDSKNPRGKFRITGVDVTVAGTTGTIVGLGQPAIQSCTTGNPDSPPVVTVDSTTGLVDSGRYYINHSGTAVAGTTYGGPLINLNGSGGGSGDRSPIDGIRCIDVLSATTFTFLDTSDCDIPTVTTAQTIASGRVQHGIDDTAGADANVDNRRMGDLEGSRLFWFTDGSLNGIHDVRVTGLDALLFNDTCGKWIVENFRVTGPMTEGWDTGLRPAAFNDHKQVILPSYAVQIEGGYDWTVRDGFVSHCAGAVSGGTGNPLKEGEQDQIEAYGTIENITCEWFFDNGIYETGRGINCRRCTLRNGIGGGVGIKVRGFNNSITYCTAEGCDSGFGLEGALSESTIDDNYGAGAAWAEISHCIARNCSTAGFWTDDNAGLWPRDLQITDNRAINCGSVVQVLATPNLPAIGAYGDRESAVVAQNRSPIKLYNVNRLDFSRNTVDDSESGGIAAYAQTDDGYLAIKLAENHFSARRMGFRSYITVSDCSNSSYNGTHFVTAVMGTPGVSAGTNDTGAGFYVKTTTLWAGSATANLGKWEHPRNDYAIYIGNAGGGSGNGQADVVGSTIRDNRVIGSKVGFRFMGVSDTDISGNQGYEINGASPTGDQRSALFSVVNLRRSTLRNNSVKPMGDRLLYVESGGIYTGITATDNVGEVTTTLASTTATPNLSGAVLWLDSDRNLDLTNGTKGDENLLYPFGTNHVNADTWITEDTAYSGTGVGEWLDMLTRMRARQETSTKKPAYKMTAAYSHGDDANLLNGYCVVRFDGGDYLKLKSAVSYAQRGTIYIVAKRTSDSPNTQALLTTTDEDTANTYLQVQENSNSAVLFRCRNGGSDTESLITTGSNKVPLNSWRIIRISSDGTNVTFAVSDGAGSMASAAASVSGVDGRWFGDIDGNLWRDSTVIGGLVNSNGETTQFVGDIACVLIYDGDVTANHAAIEAALFAKYGAL